MPYVDTLFWNTGMFEAILEGKETLKAQQLR
jgi:hypothetical protein